MGFLFVECFLYSRGITGTVADPKLILGVALKSAATGIILAHNHPSGNPQPSIQDKEITRKIQSACNFLDIKFLDSIYFKASQCLGFISKLTHTFL